MGKYTVESLVGESNRNEFKCEGLIGLDRARLKTATEITLFRETSKLA